MFRMGIGSMLWWSLVAVGEVAQGGREEKKVRIGRVRSYLSAVYPAGDFWSASSERVVQLFESLSYFYNCDERRARRLSPPARCVGEWPALPYLPPGAYYDAGAEKLSVDGWSAAASRSRWLSPLRRVEDRSDDPSTLFSTVASRVGPAPSWTNPLAIVRDDERRRWEGRLLLLEEEPLLLVEIENFGGPSWPALCGRLHELQVCGLWANVYRGSGLFMRLGAPAWISRSKATAIVEMLTEAERRTTGGDEAINVAASVASHLGIAGTTASEVAAEIYYRRLPCAHLDDDAGTAVEAWADWTALDEHAVVSRILAPNDTALDWLLGICGYGELFEKTNNRKLFTDFDGLLMILSCILGLKAVVLLRSPNDNGRFARELVDYDFPRGWPAAKGDKGNKGGDPGSSSSSTGSSFLNPIARCLPMPVARHSTKAKAPSKARDRRLPSVNELYNYWTATHKFLLADPLHLRPLFPGGHLFADRRGDPKPGPRTLPCKLNGGIWNKSLDRCTSTPLDQKNPLHRRHDCFLWCDGAFSSAHRRVSDVHMYKPSKPKSHRRPAPAAPRGVIADLSPP